MHANEQAPISLEADLAIHNTRIFRSKSTSLRAFPNEAILCESYPSSAFKCTTTLGSSFKAIRSTDGIISALNW